MDSYKGAGDSIVREEGMCLTHSQETDGSLLKPVHHADLVLPRYGIVASTQMVVPAELGVAIVVVDAIGCFRSDRVAGVFPIAYVWLTS